MLLIWVQRKINFQHEIDVHLLLIYFDPIKFLIFRLSYNLYKPITYPIIYYFGSIICHHIVICMHPVGCHLANFHQEQLSNYKAVRSIKYFRIRNLSHAKLSIVLSVTRTILLDHNFGSWPLLCLWLDPVLIFSYDLYSPHYFTPIPHSLWYSSCPQGRILMFS